MTSEAYTMLQWYFETDPFVAWQNITTKNYKDLKTTQILYTVLIHFLCGCNWMCRTDFQLHNYDGGKVLTQTFSRRTILQII